jgi:hypothetical protein
VDNAVRGWRRRARTPCGVGADFKGLGVLPALGRSGLGKARVGPDVEVGVAHARARWSAGGVVVCRYVSDWQRLTEINSKFFN